MAKILKFLSFQQLLKHILRAFSSLGGQIQRLWVRPLWFSALHYWDEPKLSCPLAALEWG